MKKLLFLLLFIPFFIGCEKEPIDDEVCWECTITETLTLSDSDDLQYFLDQGYTEDDLIWLKEVNTYCYSSSALNNEGYTVKQWEYILEDSFNHYSSTRAGVPVYFQDDSFVFSKVSYKDREAECVLITN
jgi:hypothetical protein